MGGPPGERLWADRRAKAETYGGERLDHPVVGALTLPYETFGAPR